MSTKGTPPARLSERCFRRFERTIFEVMTRFPTPVVVETTNPNTFACQLRSAMKSLYQFQWETTVPHTRFLALYESKEIVVREMPGKVVIGSRQSTRDPLLPQSGLIFKQDSSAASFDALSLACDALCALAGLRLLSAPLTLTNLSDVTAERLQQDYDILLEKVGDGVWTLT